MATKLSEHGSTLFVSNLPYSATSVDLQTLFSEIGPVRFAFVVTEPGTGVSKGVGYVSFSLKESAESAFESISKKGLKLVGRKLRVQWAESKKHQERGEADGSVKQQPSPVASVPSHASRSIVRDLSVDATEQDRLGVHGGSKDDSDGNPSESEDEDDDDDENNEEDEDENDDEEKVKPQLPHPETGCTAFIRNIPFDATEDELRTLFRSFGPLRYARITKDPNTGRSRGTGFACFWNKEDADRVVQQSKLLQAETVGQNTMPKTNPFTLPSILTPDPSSSLAQSLVLHGRTLDVVTAVTRDAAGKLKEENERARRKVDKRNMYLLKEGVILPNSPGAERLTPVEVEKRTNSFNARRALLKSNPSLYISKTRLSVRHIPTFVTERMLKRLAFHSIKTFNAEVKQGLRDPLSADELADVPVYKPGIDAEVEDKDHEKIKKGPVGKTRGVKQAKIVRQADRVDSVSGKGKSKGYGFVEMYKHSDALRFLRWTNNNPEVGELFSGVWWKEELEALLKAEQAKDENARDDDRLKRLKEEIQRVGDGDRKRRSTGTLIVEFSIENVQVVQRRNTKQKESKERPARNPDSEVATTKKRKREPDSEERDHGKRGERPPPSKKRSTTTAPQTEPAKVAKTRFANPIGSIIGRKRKERRKGS